MWGWMGVVGVFPLEKMLDAVKKERERLKGYCHTMDLMLPSFKCIEEIR